MYLINRESFEQSGDRVSTKTYLTGIIGFSYLPGTVEVTIDGETRRVPAKLYGDNELVAYGVSGKTSKGSKTRELPISSFPKYGDKIVERVLVDRGKPHKRELKGVVLWFT